MWLYLGDEVIDVAGASALLYVAVACEYAASLCGSVYEEYEEYELYDYSNLGLDCDDEVELIE